MNRSSIYIAIITAFLVLGISLQSCREDRFDLPDYTVTGEVVTLTVPISMPEMDKRTRADLDADALNRVESVWIRTYSSDSHKATSDWLKLSPNSQDTEVERDVTFETRSGNSFIVAVANVYNNYGVTKDNKNEQKQLSELLEIADTWEDFLDIAVVAPSDQQNVRAPQTPLPMAGCYSDLRVGGPHPEPIRIDEWQNRNFQPYFIPAQKETVRFDGAIHLRRLVSHLNFIVKAGENVDVTVNSYQVFNAPKFSWLYERSAVNGMYANFGDLSTEETAEEFYADVPQFGVQFITVNNNGSSSFDFWQSENKHTGTCDTYTNRDLKSGKLFTSLTGDIWTSNNEASYVLLDCEVEYKDLISVNQQGQIVESGGEDANRSGNVTYLVHLGYINGNDDAEKAKDFNCFRNVDYTYNITVNGLTDIVVDAYADPEIYHGEQGIVVDQTYSTIDIDAHYAAFNIQLTEQELSGSFGFMITAYENGQAVTITDANYQRNNNGVIEILDSETALGNVIDPKFYNWIELRPTVGEDVLAEYKPRYGYNYADNDKRTFLLTDLKGGWTSMNDAMKSNSGWYTVFVNEYTYEPMYSGTNGYANEQWNGTSERPNWMSYVNQNPRRFYIHVRQKSSLDGYSVYARSKYGVSQQSLMTYYSDQTFAPASGDIPAGTAIGVERLNETNGMNLRHTFGGGNSTANGRWNTGMWLNNANTTSTTLSINNGNANSRPEWRNYIESAKPLEVAPVIDVNRLQGGPVIRGGKFNIPGVVIMTGIADQQATFSDPQNSTDYNIEAINACMSRNRDNNGNGRIEPDELRWFVPALDQYLGMFLGESSLKPDVLMDYNRISGLPLVSLGNASYNVTGGSVINEFYTRYMFVASNSGNNVMWAMEGTSSSPYASITGWAGLSNNQIRPWQLRCIRNLGADLRSVTQEDKVSRAFVHDEGTHTIKMSYYGLASIRPNQLNGNGAADGQMPVHTIASDYNNVYYGFQYDQEDIAIPSDSRPSASGTDAQFNSSYSRLINYVNDNPCSVKGSGWRIPNQEELTIMRNVGVFAGNYGVSTLWLSCTVNFFNRFTGIGNEASIENRYFLGVLPAQGTQFTKGNLSQAGNQVYIRCVRDVNN